MTTIAWDGHTLAADKRVTVSGVRSTVTKIARGRKGNLVGCAGTAALFEGVMEAVLNGTPMPEGQHERSDWCSVLEITPDGECWKHERHGRYRIEDGFAAIGTGSDFALAAMHLGKSAADAVMVAARFDTRTGDGVDTLTIVPVLRRKGARR